MQSQHFPATERGAKDIGWLKSKFFFSFSDYYHPMKGCFGTLFALNDDLLEAGKGFGLHPHVNMEIISIMLKGKMNHKDSMGYSTVVEEGGVQIMSAGTGLRHEEYNIGEEEVSFLQVWILPKLQNITPRYQQRNFPKENRKNQLKTIVSPEEGLEHCWINQNAKLYMGYYETAQEINFALGTPNTCAFIFLIEGNITIDNLPLKEKDAIGIWDTTIIHIECTPGSQFLIIETPINQK